MKIKNMSIEELEQLSYTDLAYLVLKESKNPLKIADLFKQVCSILNYSDEQYMSKIGDFYTDVNTDKRFVNITDGLWDIRDRHSVKLDVDDDSDEDEEEPLEESTAEEMADDTEGESDDDVDDTDDTEETDLDNLSIVADDDDLGE